MECQFRFVIGLLLLLTTSSFDAFFKSDPSSATAKKLLAALPRPRFGGPVIASKADPATRELVAGCVKELEALGVGDGEGGAKGLEGGWILRWSASADVEKLNAQPKPFVLGAVFQTIMKAPADKPQGLCQVRKAMIVEKLGPERTERTYRTSLLAQCAAEEGASGLSVSFVDKKCCILHDQNSGAVDVLERSSLPGARISAAELEACLAEAGA